MIRLESSSKAQSTVLCGALFLFAGLGYKERSQGAARPALVQAKKSRLSFGSSILLFESAFARIRVGNGGVMNRVRTGR